MSDQPVASGQFITRDEFSRLETKVDEVLQLIKGQISLKTSRYASSQGPEEGVYDSIDDPGFKKQDGATGLGKDIDSQDKIHDDDEEDEESFAVLDPFSKTEESQTLVKKPVDRYTSLPNVTTEATRGNTQSSHMNVDYQIKQLNQNVELLSDQLNVSVKEVTSEYQKSIKEIKDTASFYQVEMQETVKRQTKSLEDIQEMTGRLSNQLNTIVEETRDVNDVLQNLQTSQSSEKKVASLKTENIQELKDQINDVVQSAENSIKANIGAELVWFKEQIDETVKSQVCQVLDEVKKTSQETEKWTAAISQEIRASSESVVQEIQTSVIVTEKHVDKILEEVKSSNTALSEDMRKSTETITQNMVISRETLTQDIQTLATSVREKIDQSIEDVTTKVSDSVGKSIKQVGDEIQKTVQRHGETMKANIDGVRERVESHNEKMETKTAEIQKTVESYNEKMETETAEIQKTVESHNEKMETKTAEIQKTVESHNEKMETKTAEIQKTVESHNEKMETKTAEIQKAVESHDEKIRENLQDSLTQQSENTRTHVDTKMTENSKQLKDNMYKLKREIFAFTEKECQIVRDRIEGPLSSHKLYTLDFYVENFKDLIKSGVERHSPPWHINQFKSSLQGWVQFLNNGKLSVWMMNGRHPREVGLPTRQSGSLKIKATISDTSGKLSDMEVGEKTGHFNEDGVKSNGNWGRGLGAIDCQSILDAGYADTDLPGYIKGSVLVRFLVEVL